MNFQQKYCNTKDKDKIENVDKTVLSDDAYAILELLNDIAFKLGRPK